MSVHEETRMLLVKDPQIFKSCKARLDLLFFKQLSELAKSYKSSLFKRFSFFQYYTYHYVPILHEFSFL